MFFEDSHGHSAIVLHLIDECIRWTVAVEAASKEGIELIKLMRSFNHTPVYTVKHNTNKVLVYKSIK